MGATATLRAVRRNSREAREMWDKATRAISYTLGNYFEGEDVTVEGARAWYERVTAGHNHVRITHNGRAHRIHYHSNHWVELLTPSFPENRKEQRYEH